MSTLLQAQAEGLSRPQIARRTYGRAREATPEDERATRPSLFVPAAPADSPSKTLLNRWTKSSTTWKDGISKLDAATSSDTIDEDDTPALAVSRPRLTDFSDRTEEDEEEDMEAVKKAMDRMRREARGEVVADQERPTSPLGNRLRIPEPAATKKLTVSFSSSSLTALPTSDPTSSQRLPRSSPPLHSATEDETVPIRKTGASGKRRVLDSDSEDDNRALFDTEDMPSSPPLERETSLRSSSPLQRSGVARTRASSPLEPGSDDRLAVDDFITSLTKGDDDDEPERVVRRPTSSDPVDEFDDEVTPKGKKTKEKKIKPLGKKDMKLLQSGMAANRRNRDVELNKTRTDYLPISDWLLSAGAIVNESSSFKTRDGLNFAKSPNTSPSMAVPTDDIAAFTPSSDTRHPKDHHAPGANAHASSPTAHVTRPARPENQDDEDEEEDIAMPDFDTIVAEATEKRKQEEARIARAELLKQRKAAALKAQRRAQDSDDDFEILRDVKPTLVPSIKTERRRGPDAKAILNVGSKSGPAPISKQKQAILRHAGRSTRPKEDATETFVEFAAKTFKHADMKRSNAGAKPAGQKKGRDIALTHEQLAQMMRAQHLAQAATVRSTKEQAWGRTRLLPEKREHDVEALVMASAKAEPVDEESADEDDEWVPEDEEDDEAGSGEEGDDVQLSGEEGDEAEGDEEEEEEDADNDEEAEESKENRPEAVDEDAEEAQVIRRKPRPSAKRLALDSDDEDTTPRAARKPLVEVQAPSPTHKNHTGGTLDFGGSLDFGGFGEGTQGGGFSQLFEATQTSGEPAKTDAFAGLRQMPPIGLMAANAMLPSVHISETQAARDNALIAGEVEMAMGTPAMVESQPKKQYLNDQGFFTQTKPASLPQSDLRQVLAGQSDFTMSNPTQSPGVDARVPSSTEKGSSDALLGTSSPTQGTPVLSRLKRRASPDSAADMDVDLEEEEEEEADQTPAAKERSVFSRMMANQRRREERELAKKSNLIDAQAEESDEDGGWLQAGGDEDEDDENEDGYVADLVNDETVSAEERKAQDELAAAKLRQIEAEDDAKREAEARRITEGQHRVKKRGQDFYSDDEDDEFGHKKRWSKKERRQRRLLREEGLEKLEGERNAFADQYAQGDSDTESEEETQETRPASLLDDAEESLAETNKPVWLVLRERARRNAGTNFEAQEEELDREIGFEGEVFQPRALINLDAEDGIELVQESTSSASVTVEEESQYSITRTTRTTSAIDVLSGGMSTTTTTKRSTDSYAQYVRDESQLTRRAAGAAGVSVVVKKDTLSSGASRSLTSSRLPGGRPNPPSRQSTTSSSSGSILMSKGSRFA